MVGHNFTGIFIKPKRKPKRKFFNQNEDENQNRLPPFGFFSLSL